MSYDKSETIQHRLYLSKQSTEFLAQMESIGVDKNALINSPLNIIRPRFDNIDTTCELIKSTIETWERERIKEESKLQY